MKGVLLLVLLFICFVLRVSESDGGAGEVHRMCQQPVSFEPGDEDLDVMCHDPNECSMIKTKKKKKMRISAWFYGFLLSKKRYFNN
jgi:hypothetical protein